MSTSKTYQQSLADAGSETRPPMLERGSYIPWASRFRRYINRKRENQKWLNKALDEGPYQFQMFVPTGSTLPTLQTAEDLQGDELLHYDAEIELMNLILLSIPNEIYNSVDACTTTKEMWKRFEREALVSVYNRFAQLMNDLERNKMIFPSVKKFEKLVIASRAKKLEKSHDPLALVAHTGSSSENTSILLSYVQEEVVEGSNAQNETRNVQRTLRTSSSGNTLIVQCYNCSGKRHYARNYRKPRVRDSKYFMEQMLLAKHDEAGVILTDEQNDFLFADASRMEEIKELNVNICLMARIQPTNNTSDAGPSYDSAFISEVQSSSINENKEQIGSVEKDTHVHDLYALEQLARNASLEAGKQQLFAQKVQQQNTTLTNQLELYKERVRVLENINGDNNYLNEFLEADRKAKNFNQQAQSQFIHLEAKLKKNVDLMLKLGNSLQGMFMLGPKPLSVYDPQLKHGLGYSIPYTLKQAISQCPKLYLASSLSNSEIHLNVRDTGDTLDDASKNFVHQKELSAEQKYFPSFIPSDKTSNATSSISTSMPNSKVCTYALTVSTIEPKNIKEAMADHSWIVHKNKCDVENIVVRNKTRLVAKGYIQELGMATDIAFAIFVCARYQVRPTVKHLKEVKRIFRGLWYPKDFGFELIAYSDADHAGCKDDCKSTSGGLQFLGGKLVSWSSKKQDCTPMSTAEVGYVSLSACCAQVIWMRTQLLDYEYKYNRIPMYCDSKSTIAISCHPVQHSKTKHIDIRYHFIKEHVEKGIVELYFFGTKYQLADLFTKALPKERFEYLVHHIWRYKDKVRMQIPEWMISEEMKNTKHYQITPSAPRSPNPKTETAESSAPKQSTVIHFRLPERRSTRLTPPAPVPTVDKADEMILQDTLQHLASEEIKKMIEGSENVIDDSLPPRNDEPNIPGTRLEPRSDKESPEVEIINDEEVEITNVVIPVNVNEEEEEITDEVYDLKRREKGKIVEESRTRPFPTLIRSPKIHSDLVSSDTKKLRELTVTDTKTTPSSRSPNNNLSKTNRLLSLFKAKPACFKQYKNFFQELQGRYTYLFEHLKARFLSRKSFDTLVDHLQEVMVELLPTMVDTHIKEQVKRQVPEQVQDQVLVYVAEGVILERQKTKEEMKRMIAKAILQERGNIHAEISSQI
ncbi:hypothetical protein Tco_0153401 [Tanacetum coccineum]